MCSISDFYDESKHVAKKPHRCCETGRIIQPGETYWRCKGKWEGDFREFIQSDAAYHFARYLNLVVYASKYTFDGCVVPFRHVAEAVGDIIHQSGDASIQEEWERVKRGEVTRDSTKYDPWEQASQKLAANRPGSVAFGAVS